MGNKDENTTLQEEQQTAETAGKTFTQEEVNAIVQKRLERERSKQGADEKPAAEETDREQELNQRELNIKLKETLLAKGMPIDLADILRVSDEKDIEPVLTRLGDYAKSIKIIIIRTISPPAFSWAHLLRKTMSRLTLIEKLWAYRKD